MIVGLKYLLTISSLVVLTASFSNAAETKITNIYCTSKNASLGDFKLCSLKAVKRGVVELNVHFRLLKKPVDDVTFVLQLKKRGDLSQRSLYHYKVDLCEFLRSERRKPLANLFYAVFDLKQYSNINHTCPYDHDIIVNRCRLNANFLNALPIASGEYSISTNWIIYNRPIADVNVTIKVD